jgi:hypothetical protein
MILFLKDYTLISAPLTQEKISGYTFQVTIVLKVPKVWTVKFVAYPFPCGL